MTWNDVLTFVRGPLFKAALLFFIAGMVYRLARVVFLGLKRDKVPPKGSKVKGVANPF